MNDSATERRHPDGNERVSVQPSFAEIQLELLSTLLDCPRNLCRQDDGVPFVVRMTVFL